MSCSRPAVARWLNRWRCTRASKPTPSSPPLAIALTSPPAQKAPPAPVNTTQPTSSAISTSSRSSPSASSIAPDSALRRSGRFIVSTATPSSTRARRSSVPVSISRMAQAYSSSTVSYSPGMTRSLLAHHPVVGSALRPANYAQRARLLDAMIRFVAERGYAAASVTDVVRAAAVSRSTFYELFASKEACFLEAYRVGVEVVDERVGEAVRAAAHDWRAQLRAGIRAYLPALDGDPVFTRAHLLQIHAARPPPLAARPDAPPRLP